MRVHFIAIGGSAMHNLAIALKRKGDIVTGSDDEIFEPSKGRLDKEGILPTKIGWDINNIHTELDAIILGMHARIDNPELLRAQELGLKIYSYPEFVQSQALNKKRLVVGGSHGKTTITSMLLHVMNQLNIETDFLVGALLEGFDCMVQLTDAPYMVIEGDEYLSSPIDRRPKFHWYAPDIAIISGIAWDHINVFPTFENYVEQFKIFTDKIAENGTLIYYKNDTALKGFINDVRPDINAIEYSAPNYTIEEGLTLINLDGKTCEFQIFGQHNIENMIGAKLMLNEIGVSDADFYAAMGSFKGAAKRLEKIAENSTAIAYKDFAHSPSKLKATVKAVNEQYPDRKLVACMELHTFSSLKKDFLPHYKNAMAAADIAIVYFSHDVVAHKKLDPITKEDVKAAFGTDNVVVLTDADEFVSTLKEMTWKDANLLLMSSGNFHGLDLNKFAKELLGQ